MLGSPDMAVNRHTEQFGVSDSGCKAPDACCGVAYAKGTGILSICSVSKYAKVPVRLAYLSRNPVPLAYAMGSGSEFLI